MAQKSQFSLFGSSQSDFGTWIQERPAGGFAHTISLALNPPQNSRIGTGLLYTDCAGFPEWQKVYGFENESLISRKFMLKGDRAVLLGSYGTGLNSQKTHILELGPSGDVLAEYAFLASQTELAKDILPWPSGGYLVLNAGNYNVDYETAQLFLVNSSFTIVQSLSYALTQREFEPESFLLLDDGRVLMCGHASSATTFRQGWVMLLNNGGIPVWAKSFEGPFDVQFQDMVLDDAGLIHIAGYLYQLNTGYDGCLIQMNLNGDVLKEQSFHSTLDDRFRCLDVAHGELMVGGDAGDFDNRSMIWMRTNLNQSLKDSWKLTYGAPFTNYVYCVSPKKSGNWLLTGEFTAPNVLRDGGMVITDSISGGNCLGEAFPFQVSPLSLNHANLNVIRTENNRTREETSVQIYTLPIIQAEDVCNEIPPKAQFAYTAKPNCPEVCVDFSDSSLCNIQEWFWEFESGIPAISTEQNPSVCFPGDGYYEVRLIVKNDGGSDTLISQVILKVGCDLPVPNAFSPNGDGFNDLFVIPGIPPGSKLRVFNRWGNVVFEADDYDNSWDANNVTGGTYFYAIESLEGIADSGYIVIVK